MPSEHALEFDFVRKDVARQVVYGWLYVCKDDQGKTVIDHSGEFVRPETLEKAMENFVLECRTAAEMHMTTDGTKSGPPSQVGRLVAAITMTDEIKLAMGIDPAVYKRVGAFVGFKIDNEGTWKRVQSGELRAFSFRGPTKRRVVEVPDAA